MVGARAGDRHSYAPITTPLSRTPDPLAVVEGLLQAWPANQVYIADLDAIQGVGENSKHVTAIAERFPELELWVDAGLATCDQVRNHSLPTHARVVLGTESQRDEALTVALSDTAILSLDSRGGTRLGPAILHEEASVWPRTVIVMTLARVGMGAGPDLETIQKIVARAEGRAVFAAGGVRDWADCEALQAVGASGALVASALHHGRLRFGQRDGEA